MEKANNAVKRWIIASRATRKKVGSVPKAYEYADGSKDHGADMDVASEPMSQFSRLKGIQLRRTRFRLVQYIPLSATFTLQAAQQAPSKDPDTVIQPGSTLK